MTGHMEAVKQAARSLREEAIGFLAENAGYDRRNWLRVAQVDSFLQFLRDNADDSARVLEISPGWNRTWKENCAHYSCVDFPDFNIETDVSPERYDIVIADQVLEHVRRPVQAVRNIREMLRDGGYALIATPFLFRIHARPYDFSRWSAEGLRQLLVEGGFSIESINVESWGNKQCVRAHIGGSVKDYGWFKPMANDPEYPVMVWAFARRTDSPSERD